jgi:hypothetical protein
MGRIVVRSDAVIMKEGKILTEDGELIGGWLREGDDCEAGFRRKAEEKNLSVSVEKPLSPMILWKLDEKGRRVAIVSLNYLAKLNNKE